jgi:general secretion pathway protein G
MCIESIVVNGVSKNNISLKLRNTKMKAKHGFTLVEILIVVVILGILAAIVIPQFTEASTEAKQSSLVSSLQTIRSQIELYKIQHNDKLPATTSDQAFKDCMTKYTNVDGTQAASQVSGQANVYGPYMQKIPLNPFSNSDVVTFTSSTTGSSATGGWNLDPATGKFRADDNGLCADTTPHSSL